MLTKNTPLARIRDLVMEDFQVEITNEDARVIREAHRKGCLVWTPDHIFVSTLNDRLRITPGQIS